MREREIRKIMNNPETGDNDLDSSIKNFSSESTSLEIKKQTENEKNYWKERLMVDYDRNKLKINKEFKEFLIDFKGNLEKNKYHVPEMEKLIYDSRFLKLEKEYKRCQEMKEKKEEYEIAYLYLLIDVQNWLTEAKDNIDELEKAIEESQSIEELIEAIKNSGLETIDGKSGQFPVEDVIRNIEDLKSIKGSEMSVDEEVIDSLMKTITRNMNLRGKVAELLEKEDSSLDETTVEESPETTVVQNNEDGVGEKNITGAYGIAYKSDKEKILNQEQNNLLENSTDTEKKKSISFDHLNALKKEIDVLEEGREKISLIIKERKIKKESLSDLPERLKDFEKEIEEKKKEFKKGFKSINKKTDKGISHLEKQERRLDGKEAKKNSKDLIFEKTILEASYKEQIEEKKQQIEDLEKSFRGNRDSGVVFESSVRLIEKEIKEMEGRLKEKDKEIEKAIKQEQEDSNKIGFNKKIKERLSEKQEELSELKDSSKKNQKKEKNEENQEKIEVIDIAKKWNKYIDRSNLKEANQEKINVRDFKSKIKSLNIKNNLINYSDAKKIIETYFEVNGIKLNENLIENFFEKKEERDKDTQKNIEKEIKEDDKNKKDKAKEDKKNKAEKNKEEGGGEKTPSKKKKKRKGFLWSLAGIFGLTVGFIRGINRKPGGGDKKKK